MGFYIYVQEKKEFCIFKLRKLNKLNILKTINHFGKSGKGSSVISMIVILIAKSLLCWYADSRRVIQLLYTRKENPMPYLFMQWIFVN